MRYFGTGAEVSGQFGTSKKLVTLPHHSVLVPNCLGAKVSGKRMPHAYATGDVIFSIGIGIGIAADDGIGYWAPARYRSNPARSPKQRNAKLGQKGLRDLLLLFWCPHHIS